MADISDEQRIRAGLKFLTYFDKKIIRVSSILERLIGNPKPQGVGDLLSVYRFSVGGVIYKGKMTKAKAASLQGSQGTPRQFADAVSGVLIGITDNAFKAEADLLDGLVGPRARVGGDGGIADWAATICCSYDTDQKASTSRTTCENGLLGQVVFNGPCDKIL